MGARRISAQGWRDLYLEFTNSISKGTYIGQLLGAIETGEQAIAFFAKHGSGTPIKFVNCKRKPVSPDQFRPYDLVKVDEGDDKALEDEYFTISAQGVVHVYP